MPALPPYIPARDSQLSTWAANFSALITAAPATYGLVAGDATAIAGVNTTYQADYALVTSPSTRTPQAVSNKNTAKINLLNTIRPYAQNISLNAGVSSANKIALGINPRTSVPTPITAPTTYPTLSVTGALALQHILRFRDSTSSPSVKAKPYGVVQIQIFGQASGTPITDPTVLPFLQSPTKSPVLQAWASQSVGLKAYYAARWVTRKGLVGPWSPIVNFTIAG